MQLFLKSIPVVDQSINVTIICPKKSRNTSSSSRMTVPKKSKQIGTTIQTTLSHFTCNQSKTLGSFVRSKQACMSWQVNYTFGILYYVTVICYNLLVSFAYRNILDVHLSDITSVSNQADLWTLALPTDGLEGPLHKDTHMPRNIIIHFRNT